MSLTPNNAIIHAGSILEADHRTQLDTGQGRIPMIPQLSAALQMFLISISILMLAIAIARTDALKTLVSLLALGTSLLCLVRVWTWKEISFGDRFTAVALALIFIVATAASTFVYGKAASRRGGLNQRGLKSSAQDEANL